MSVPCFRLKPNWWAVVAKSDEKSVVAKSDITNESLYNFMFIIEPKYREFY